jgi:predicted RNA binding protein YcfA (HicA-like mRNA interferase family)
MSRKEKLKEKLLDSSQDQNWRIDDLCTLLLQFEFSERKGKGSHRIFYKEGIEDLIDLQPVKGGKAKPYQVRQVRNIVKDYQL